MCDCRLLKLCRKQYGLHLLLQADFLQRKEYVRGKYMTNTQGRSFGLNIGAALEILVRQNGVIFGKIGFYCIFM